MLFLVVDESLKCLLARLPTGASGLLPLRAGHVENAAAGLHEFWWRLHGRHGLGVRDLRTAARDIDCAWDEPVTREAAADCQCGNLSLAGGRLPPRFALLVGRGIRYRVRIFPALTSLA
jgi:hypothetical protein